MVKNHQHGVVGAVKHGSGEHLRDRSAKRARLDVAACASTPGGDGGRLASKLACNDVDLTGEDGMSTGEFDALVEFVSMPSCVATALNINCIGFGPVCAEKLAGAIAANTSLRTLKLQRNGLGIAGGGALGTALSHNASLTSLDISLNDVAPEGGVAIAAGLGANGTLTELTMVHACMHTCVHAHRAHHGARMHAHVRTRSQSSPWCTHACTRAYTLTELTMVHACMHTCVHAHRAHHGARMHAHVRTHSQSSPWCTCACTRAGTHAGMQGARVHARTHACIQVRCGLGPGGGKALGEALQRNSTLRSLDITQNDLGVEGGVAFGAALAVNTTLASLNMRFNRIGFGLERASSFAKALEARVYMYALEVHVHTYVALPRLWRRVCICMLWRCICIRMYMRM